MCSGQQIGEIEPAEEHATVYFNKEHDFGLFLLENSEDALNSAPSDVDDGRAGSIDDRRTSRLVADGSLAGSAGSRRRHRSPSPPSSSEAHDFEDVSSTTSSSSCTLRLSTSRRVSNALRKCSARAPPAKNLPSLSARPAARRFLFLHWCQASATRCGGAERKNTEEWTSALKIMTSQWLDSVKSGEPTFIDISYYIANYLNSEASISWRLKWNILHVATAKDTRVVIVIPIL